MNATEAIETLRQCEQILRERGVQHAALFGSVARSESSADSDIDIMIEIDSVVRMTAFEYVDLKGFIAGRFDEPVDVVNREALKPRIRPAVIADLCLLSGHSPTNKSAAIIGQ